MEITALNYPIICSPLPSKVKVDYPHLEDLQLAESLNDNYRTIDIHIGCQEIALSFRTKTKN